MDDYWFNIKSIIITSLRILRSSHVICQSDNILFQEDYQGVIHKGHRIYRMQSENSYSLYYDDIFNVFDLSVFSSNPGVCSEYTDLWEKQ